MVRLRVEEAVQCKTFAQYVQESGSVFSTVKENMTSTTKYCRFRIFLQNIPTFLYI